MVRLKSNEITPTQFHVCSVKTSKFFLSIQPQQTFKFFNKLLIQSGHLKMPRLGQQFIYFAKIDCKITLLRNISIFCRSSIKLGSGQILNLRTGFNFQLSDSVRSINFLYGHGTNFQLLYQAKLLAFKLGQAIFFFR